MRWQLERKFRETVASTLDSLQEKQDTAWPEVEAELAKQSIFQLVRHYAPSIGSANPSGDPVRLYLRYSGKSIVHRKPTVPCVQATEARLIKTTSPQRKDYVVESSFWLVPSSWLAKFGISHAVNMQLARSSYTG